MMVRFLHCRESSKRIGQGAEGGFTFTETLVALLIVVLLTAFVAQSIPVAINTYRQVVGASNAQVALSTTSSALRDELGLAIAVKPASGGSVYYQTSDGTWSMIENGTNGLVKHVYAQDGPHKVGSEISDMSPVDLIPSTMIVGAAGGEDLHVQMTGEEGAYITYGNGVFTVHGIQVLLGDDVVESVGEYSVKAVLNPELVPAS